MEVKYKRGMYRQLTTLREQNETLISENNQLRLENQRLREENRELREKISAMESLYEERITVAVAEAVSLLTLIIIV